MKTHERSIERRSGGISGTKTLVAVEDFFEPGRACLAGELLLPRAGHHDGFGRAETAAAALLDEVADIEDGRLLRRKEGVLLPFPVEARITADGLIEYHVSDEP